MICLLFIGWSSLSLPGKLSPSQAPGIILCFMIYPQGQGSNRSGAGHQVRRGHSTTGRVQGGEAYPQDGETDANTRWNILTSPASLVLCFLPLWLGWDCPKWPSLFCYPQHYSFFKPHSLIGLLLLKENQLLTVLSFFLMYLRLLMFVCSTNT